MTNKERTCTAFAFVAAALAAYGSMQVAQKNGLSEEWLPLVGLGILFGTLILTLRGVDAIQQDRWRREIDVTLRNQKTKSPSE